MAPRSSSTCAQSSCMAWRKWRRSDHRGSDHLEDDVFLGDEDTRARHVDEGQLVVEKPLHRGGHRLGILGCRVEVDPYLGHAIVGFTGAATIAHTVGQC